MEKIQQALERAKKQRTGAGVQDPEKTAAVPVQSIEYTRTQTIEGHTHTQREHRLLSAMEHNEYVEAFKILSTQVMQRMGENHWSTLGITSPGDDTGKTTTAINLGISIAKEIEYTVLLVDANLRKPELHRYFGITPEIGLSDYLQNDLDLADLLIKPNNIDHFVILPGGTPTMNSSEMLGSPKMCSLVEELKERYPKRIIIFDLPPVLNTADTLSFIPCLDAELVVIEDDVTKEADLVQTLELLSVSNVIGTVLNKSR